MIGSRLGPYEITAKLGEGGMGEVYRATDSKLKREVAIKVLPQGFTEDKERLARFEREAQLLAQLHHPNIASIFGMEESEGTKALVMELVDGPTLAERLESGSLPVDQALLLARQIAEALEEAHEKGIIHRDLKPQNIKASREGKVKVLDFGLAKAMDPAAASGSTADLARSPNLMQSPTLTAVQGTQLGVILGTAAYMAPEQARGGAVDKRADIWAFGVVLWEMLTGRTLFAADTVSDTLAGVLKGEIDLAALPDDVPPAIRRLLRRCLERSPTNRLHDIADARLVIDDVVSGESGAVAAEPAVATPRPLWRRGLPWALAAAALLWAVWATLHGDLGRTRSGAPRIAFTVPWHDASGGQAFLRSVELSRDGRRLLIWDSSGKGFLVRDLDRFTSRLLPGTANASNPFFSPDGDWVGFVADGELEKLSLAGGDPVKLCAANTDSPGGAWGADGYIYFTPSWNTGLWRVSDQGGTAERLTEADPSNPGSFHGWPSPLPDGRGVVFTVNGASGIADARIAFLDAATKQVFDVGPGAAAQVLANGDLVFFRHGSWFAASFDARAGKLTGPARRVLPEARPLYPAAGKERVFSFSDEGRLVYIASSSTAFSPYSQLAWIDRAGHVERLPFEGPHMYDGIALSPDGRRAAVSVYGEGELQLWVYDLGSGTRDRLTRDGSNENPSWSPDSSRLVFTHLGHGNYDLDLLDADTPGPPVDFVATPADEDEAQWTPDGRAIVFTHTSPKTGLDVWMRGIDETGPGKPVVETPYDDQRPQISPDGRWLAYRSQGAFYVTGFPEAGERTKIPADGSMAVWSPSTPEIFAVEGGRLVSYRYEIVGGRFHVTGSQALFEVPDLATQTYFSVSRDAQRFLLFVPVPGKTLEPEVRVVTDGFAELSEAPTPRP